MLALIIMVQIAASAQWHAMPGCSMAHRHNSAECMPCIQPNNLSTTMLLLWREWASMISGDTSEVAYGAHLMRKTQTSYAYCVLSRGLFKVLGVAATTLPLRNNLFSSQHVYLLDMLLLIRAVHIYQGQMHAKQG